MSGPEDHTAEVCVVGSINQDLFVSVDRHPKAGETVLGGDWFAASGGKGANQAVAAARLGRRVVMVGCVGNDTIGQGLVASLCDEDIDIATVHTVDAPTGRAFITVEAGGENRIVVSPGANGRLTGDIVRASRAVADASVVLVQLEVPEDAVAAAIEVAGGRVLLNPAPARALPTELLARVDVLLPNRGELALLAQGTATGDFDGPDIDELVDQARSLGVPAVVVTLGSRGSLVVEGSQVTRIQAVAVEAVDTTGAGDTFCGAMADALVDGAGLVDACRWAARAAAVTVTRRGAQPAMPQRHEVGE